MFQRGPSFYNFLLKATAETRFIFKSLTQSVRTGTEQFLPGEVGGIFQGQAWNSVSFKFTDLRPEESLSLNSLSSH